MTLLVLSGRPGAGKTEVGKWLASRRDFTHVETDVPADWEDWWQLLCGSQNPKVAAEVVAKVPALGSEVVIEWGFKVELLDRVHPLRDAGFDARVARW
jgi:broad-specificity NMP kinase